MKWVIRLKSRKGVEIVPIQKFLLGKVKNQQRRSNLTLSQTIKAARRHTCKIEIQNKWNVVECVFKRQ